MTSPAAFDSVILCTSWVNEDRSFKEAKTRIDSLIPIVCEFMQVFHIQFADQCSLFCVRLLYQPVLLLLFIGSSVDIDSERRYPIVRDPLSYILC